LLLVNNKKSIKNTYFQFLKFLLIKCDKKENTSEQALQIMGHVVAEFCANKRSIHGRRQFVVSNVTIVHFIIIKYRVIINDCNPSRRKN
jgi:hypothetical protein